MDRTATTQQQQPGSTASSLASATSSSRPGTRGSPSLRRKRGGDEHCDENYNPNRTYPHSENPNSNTNNNYNRDGVIGLVEMNGSFDESGGEGRGRERNGYNGHQRNHHPYDDLNRSGGKKKFSANHRSAFVVVNRRSINTFLLSVLACCTFVGIFGTLRYAPTSPRGGGRPQDGPLLSSPSFNDSFVTSQMLQSDAVNVRTLYNIDYFPDRSNCTTYLDPNDIHTTLVMQASLNRIWVLQETCQRYEDPIVVVLTKYPNENLQEYSRMVTHVRESCPFQLTLIEYHLTEEEAKPANYPVNSLRNIGLEHVSTSHAIVVDMDFIPSDQLDYTIRITLQGLNKIRDEHNIQNKFQNKYSSIRYGGGVVNLNGTDEDVLLQPPPPPPPPAPPESEMVLVVPAFERLLAEPCTTEEDCARYLKEDSDFIPKDFDALRECYHNEECCQFHERQFKWGHSTTRTATWFRMGADPDTSYDVREIGCFLSIRYEPYLVVRWCPAAPDTDQINQYVQRKEPLPKPKHVTPFFDERFVGYGYNKVQWVQHLRVMGRKFYVLPQGFFVHNPHPESKSRLAYMEKKNVTIPVEENKKDNEDSVDEKNNDLDSDDEKKRKAKAVKVKVVGSEMKDRMTALYKDFFKALRVKYEDREDKITGLCQGRPSNYTSSKNKKNKRK